MDVCTLTSCPPPPAVCVAAPGRGVAAGVLKLVLNGAACDALRVERDSWHAAPAAREACEGRGVKGEV